MELFAYFDPNILSLVLQCLAVVVLGAMCTIRLYWLKVKTFFAGRFGGSKRTETEEEATLKISGDENSQDRQAA